MRTTKTSDSRKILRSPLRPEYFARIALVAAFLAAGLTAFGQEEAGVGGKADDGKAAVSSVAAGPALVVGLARFLPDPTQTDGGPDSSNMGILLPRLIAESLRPLPDRLAGDSGFRPLSFWKGYADGHFLESAAFSTIPVVADLSGMDFLITGRYAREGAALLLELRGFAADASIVPFAWKGSFPYADPRPSVQAISAKLLSWLAGRPISRPAMQAGAQTGAQTGTQSVVAPIAPVAPATPEKGIALPVWQNSGEFPEIQNRFRTDLGMLAVSIPLAVLAIGNFNLYTEAYSRNASFAGSYYWSGAGMGLSLAACAAFAVNAGFGLAHYLAATK